MQRLEIELDDGRAPGRERREIGGIGGLRRRIAEEFALFGLRTPTRSAAGMAPAAGIGSCRE